MNRNHSVAHAVGLAILAMSINTGCIGMSIFGLPLGPQAQSGGLVVMGVKRVEPLAQCLVNTGPPYFVGPGRLELAVNGRNNYLGVLDVRNNLLTNDRITPAPTYGGDWGSVSSNTITIVGATLTYEFPGLSPLFKFRNQQRPSDGVFLTNGNTALGSSIAEGFTSPVGVVLIDKPFGDQLINDPEFSSALQTAGSVTVVVRVTLEGRSGSGFRVASNEFTYQVDVEDLSNPGCADPADECPAQVCIIGQDFPSRVCGTRNGGVLTCP